MEPSGIGGRHGDTIAAHSSGRPPAAVAIVRASGPAAHAAALSLCGDLPPPRHAGLRTLRHPVTGDHLDTALVLRFDGPSSATGEDIVEFHCHGGRAVVAAVLDAVTSCPHVRLADPGEFTRRALANGRIDLTEAEGLADLLEAETEAQRRAALAVAGGALSRQVAAWQSAVVDLSARAEAAIDYVGDEDETAIDAETLQFASLELAGDLERWLAKPRIERLKDGIRVVVAGPPNVGKSSLINALTGVDRVIVSSVAGTTLDTIEVPLTVEGIPLVLIDTAGLRETLDPIETIGVARAEQQVEQAEILLWLGDVAAAPPHDQLILVHSKADLGPQRTVNQIAVSAHTGEGLSHLIQTVSRRCQALLPAPDQVALNARHAGLLGQSAELLRTTPSDIVLLAENLRSARLLFDQMTGRSGVEDALDAIFTRFCLGK